MKNLLSVFVLCLFVSSISAQVTYYRTKHKNFGFGINSSCSTNEFMDFVVNGPLVGGDRLLPVGGYINNSTVVKEWVTPESGGGNFAITNGCFGLGQDGAMHMVSFENRDELPRMIWAIQNGPILVQEGKNMRGTSTSLYARSGIGYKKDGTVVVIISLTPITFWAFAELFLNEDCVNSVYLDGGPYVGYADKTGSYGSLQPGATKIQCFNN